MKKQREMAQQMMEQMMGRGKEDRRSEEGQPQIQIAEAWTYHRLQKMTEADAEGRRVAAIWAR